MVARLPMGLSPSSCRASWDAAILRRRCADDHSLPSEGRESPAQQPALAGARCKHNAFLHTHSLAGLRSKEELTLISLLGALIGRLCSNHGSHSSASHVMPLSAPQFVAVRAAKTENLLRDAVGGTCGHVSVPSGIRNALPIID